MSLILTLRKKTSHAGIPLIHETSEDVVLATVFGTVKNISHDAVLNPWLYHVTSGTIPAAEDWHLSFWEAQLVPAGVPEGPTKVDLEMDSEPALVFTEVKMDAPPSAGTIHDPDRDQLTRNLDIGHEKATRLGKAFAVIYITPDAREPAIVAEVRRGERSFPANPGVPATQITSRLFWCSWGSIGVAVHDALESDALGEVEKGFAFDLLAYLKMKGLWNAPLSEKLAAEVQGDKLYRALLPEGTFIPYGANTAGPSEAWRGHAWDESEVKQLLAQLNDREQAMLKVLAEAPEGSVRQGELLEKLLFLAGNPGALRSLKNGISRACKRKDKAPLLSIGVGTGDNRWHEINRRLRLIRDLVIEQAKRFRIPQGLIQE
jgi:hypothetical protein